MEELRYKKPSHDDIIRAQIISLVKSKSNPGLLTYVFQ